MESKTKLFFGHPIHPMLITLPLGLFTATIILDTINLLNGNSGMAIVAFFNIVVGVIGGLVAAIFGFIDWLAIPVNTRAKSVGGWHGIGNVIVVAFFAISGWMRYMNNNYEPSQLALIFSYGGILLGLCTAWLGGELVYRLSIGVDRDANVNAPSSLSAKSVSTTRKASQTSKPVRR